MKKVAIVAIGGALGSLLRYLIAEQTNKYEAAIFLANLLGVLVAGVISYRMKPTESQELFWITGFAGGFTTFSAYSAESLQLFQSGHSVSALVYVAVSNIGGILFAGLGYTLLKNH